MIQPPKGEFAPVESWAYEMGRKQEGGGESVGFTFNLGDAAELVYRWMRLAVVLQIGVVVFDEIMGQFVRLRFRLEQA